ncbi:hypothetical protein [Nonomuraea salmonea]|uniref:hypothetical protein n=1 Tax=Nonomuraea salmonea TaxID=46181 RepID=UPI0031F0B55C
MDGCNEWGVYRHVVLPMLRPVTLSALIILGHISLKVFDLIVAVSGKQIITDVPAVFMWVAVFDSHDPAKGGHDRVLHRAQRGDLRDPVPDLVGA